jgi:ribose 5-phosphate isomerase
MGSVGAGSATVGLGYTSKTTKNGDDELNPSTLNGYVTVGLGSGQQVGASFEVLEDGTEEDEATATRISASYATPFFVEAITLKLGAGTTTQTSDLDSKSGTSSGFEAEWVYNF